MAKVPAQRRGGSKAWELLDEALSAGPDPLAFRAASAALLRFDADELGEALEHARAALERWADADRAAPWTWSCALAKGVREPGAALMRELHLRSEHLGCKNVALSSIEEGALREVRALYADGIDLSGSEQPTALETLSLRSSGYRSLRRVTQRWGDDDAPVLLARCGWFHEATALDLEHARELFGDDPCGSAPHLSRLSVTAPQIPETLRYLDRHGLPALRALELRGPTFPEIPPADPPLAGVALLRRLDDLSLHEAPAAVVRGLFRSGLLALRGLSLHGHGDTAYGGLKPADVRLGEADLRLMAKSGALSAIERLAICRELAGDALVELVGCTEPGRLRELRLESVALTDEGAKRLAALPHLRHLERLDVRGNDIGPEGMAALMASLSGGSLRKLAVGARGGTPHYVDTSPRQDGDEFARLVGRTDLPGLSELVFTRLALGQRGARALAEAGWARGLERLDLSHDRLGPDGVGALLAGGLPRHLRSLLLDECSIDEASIGAIVRAPFERLRDLSLGYSNVEPRAAESLAAGECLGSLFRLSLHDAYVGDAGLRALARSRHLTRLVELDIERDCGDSHRQTLGVEAARALCESESLASLDALYGGMVDAYHGGRYTHAFDAQGMALLVGATRLRAPALHGLLATEVLEEDSLESGQR